MGEKLVMHYRGPKEIVVKYNRYVVNRKLFRTFAIDIRKRTQNSGVSVPTIDGETYYGKLTQILRLSITTGQSMSCSSVIGQTT